MTRVTITEPKSHLSRQLRAVENGAQIEVTDRRRPIARLIPTRVSVGEIRIIPAQRRFAELRNRRYPKARWRTDSLRPLLEERGRR